MRSKPSREQVAWAAGLFEGEGCMSFHGRVGKRGGHAQMRLGMTDRDVVEKFGRIVGCGNLYEAHGPANRAKGHKPVFTWTLYTAAEVVSVIELLMPLFGARRTEKAEKMLAFARQIEVHKGLKQYCPKGHPYSGDNLLTEPITRRSASGEVRKYSARRCKTCRRTQERERKAKARERK